MIGASKMVAFAGGKRAGGNQAGKKGDVKDSPPVDFKTYAEGKYAELAPVLEENAAVIQEMASDLGVEPADVMSGATVPEDVSARVKDDFEDLDEGVQEAFGVLEAAAEDEIVALAKHLADGGLVEDADEVAAWLCLVSSEVFDGEPLKDKLVAPPPPAGA